MTWFRTNIRASAGLALFALALQFVLAFGHNHGPLHIAAPGAGLGLLAQEARTYAPPASTPSQDADDFCAICASISLAGSLVMPAAPVLAQPFTTPRARLPHALVATVTGKPQLPFAARAPPV